MALASKNSFINYYLIKVNNKSLLLQLSLIPPLAPKNLAKNVILCCKVTKYHYNNRYTKFQNQQVSVQLSSMVMISSVFDVITMILLARTHTSYTIIVVNAIVVDTNSTPKTQNMQRHLFQIQSTFFGQFIVFAWQADPSSPTPMILNSIFGISIDDQSSCYA